MSYKRSITDTSLQILGIHISHDDRSWAEMNSLRRVHGQPRAEQAFRDWCESRAGEELRYPLNAFLAVAGSILNETPESGPSFARVRKTIEEISLARLGTTIYPAASEWNDIKTLMGIHGGDVLIQQFRDWSEQQSKTEITTYPLRKFLKVAPGLMAGMKSPEPPQTSISSWQQRIERLESEVRRLSAAVEQMSTSVEPEGSTF